MYFILNTDSPEKAITIWERTTQKKFDFSNNRIDIEIKTSLNRHNIHTFSDEQLQDMSPLLKRYIFSHYLDEDVSGGQSISDLVNEIRDILTRVELFEKRLWKPEYLI
ncbi:hypothetical protein JN25_01660 [Bacillus sp. BSC154]|nr:hypothetical protein JN25_01660 [Bacillus sp. BSC154]